MAQCFYFLLLFFDFPEQGICPNFIQGDGASSSGESSVGNVVDVLDCVKKVQEQFPQADGITASADGKTKCFAEFDWTHAADSYYGSKWQTCKINKQTGI